MYKLENLKNRSLDEVDNLYRQGFVSQDDFESFCHAWRVNSFRYSHECIGFTDGPCSVLCKCGGGS